MSIEENKALVRRFWTEVWNEGNLDLLDSLFAPSLVVERRYFISKTREAFANSHVTIEELIAEGDLVVTRYAWRGVHTGVWNVRLEGLPMGVLPVRRAVWDRGIAIHRVRDGRIVEGWSEWTKLELAQQLGVVHTCSADEPA